MTTTTERQATPQGRARRLEKAKAIVQEGGVRRWRGGYLVRGSKGKTYAVEGNPGRCECEDYQRHQHLEGFSCKHVLAAGIYEFGRRFGPVVILPPGTPQNPGAPVTAHQERQEVEAA